MRATYSYIAFGDPRYGQGDGVSQCIDGAMTWVVRVPDEDSTAHQLRAMSAYLCQSGEPARRMREKGGEVAPPFPHGQW